MRFIFSILALALFATPSAAQFASGNYTPGFFSTANYAQNPSCAKNARNIVGSGTPAVITRTTSSPLENVASCSVAGTTSTDKVKWSTNTFDAALKNQNCEARLYYNGDGSKWKAYVEQGSGPTKVSQDYQLSDQTGAGSSATIIVPFACGDPANASKVVLEATASSPATIKVSSVYIGLAVSLAPSSVGTTWTDAGAVTITGTTTNPTKGGTISQDHHYWRRVGSNLEGRFEFGQTSTGTDGSGDYLFQIPPSSGCTIDSSKVDFYTTIGSGSAGPWNIIGTFNGQVIGTASGNGSMSAYDTTHIRAIVKDSSTQTYSTLGSSVFHLGQQVIYAGTYSVPCQGWTTLTAIKSDQSNYDWTQFSPIAIGSQGFGTIAADSCFHKRDGKNLIVDCKITAGTVAASEARITLPNSLAISSTEFPSIRICGTWARANTSATTNKRGVVLCNGANTYFNFSNDDYTGTVSPLVAQNGNTIFLTSDVISFTARVPINSWIENNKAPLLVGSITSNTSSTERIERIYFTCSSASTIISQSGSWVSSIANISTGACAITVATGMFSATPTCVATWDAGNTSIVTSSQVRVGSTTSITVGFASQSSGTTTIATNVNAFMICMGPR